MKNKLKSFELKVSYLLLLIINPFFATVLSQKSTDNTWIKINVERKDGSRIVQSPYKKPTALDSEMTYIFENNDTISIETIFDKIRTNYSIEGSLLKIGKHQEYEIETISDSLLSLAEPARQGLTDDKLNRFLFIKYKYYNDYVLKNNLAIFENDSTIVSNRYFRAKYVMKDINGYFRRKLGTVSDFYIIGSFYVSNGGSVKNATITESQQVTKKMKKTIVDAILNTNGYWKTPVVKNINTFKVNFILQGAKPKNLGLPGFSSLSFNITDPKPFCIDCTSLNSKKIESIKDHLSKGNLLFKNNKIENAIIHYNKCIEIDSTFFEAYYNRAYGYFKLKKNENACKDWKYLRDFDQTNGKIFYNKHCK